MADPYLTREDLVQIIDWVDGIGDLARRYYGMEPADKLRRLRGALADSAAHERVYLVASPRLPERDRCGCNLVLGVDEVCDNGTHRVQR